MRSHSSLLPFVFHEESLAECLSSAGKKNIKCYGVKHVDKNQVKRKKGELMTHASEKWVVNHKEKGGLTTLVGYIDASINRRLSR